MLVHFIVGVIGGEDMTDREAGGLPPRVDRSGSYEVVPGLTR